jgi:hypothetical protein
MARLIKTKTYTITVEDFDDGESNMSRVNDGFNIVELMGFMSFIDYELKQQMLHKSVSGIDVIERKVVQPEKRVYIVLTYVAEDMDKEGDTDVAEFTFLDLEKAKEYADKQAEKYSNNIVVCQIYEVHNGRTRYIS